MSCWKPVTAVVFTACIILGTYTHAASTFVDASLFADEAITSQNPWLLLADKTISTVAPLAALVWYLRYNATTTLPAKDKLVADATKQFSDALLAMTNVFKDETTKVRESQTAILEADRKVWWEKSETDRITFAEEIKLSRAATLQAAERFTAALLEIVRQCPRHEQLHQLEQLGITSQLPIASSTAV
jgi:hypothetical protein